MTWESVLMLGVEVQIEERRKLIIEVGSRPQDERLGIGSCGCRDIIRIRAGETSGRQLGTKRSRGTVGARLVAEGRKS